MSSECEPHREEKTVALAHQQTGRMATWIEYGGGAPVRGLMHFFVGENKSEEAKVQIVKNGLTREAVELALQNAANDMIVAFSLK